MTLGGGVGPGIGVRRGDAVASAMAEVSGVAVGSGLSIGEEVGIAAADAEGTTLASVDGAGDASEACGLGLTEGVGEAEQAATATITNGRTALGARFGRWTRGTATDFTFDPFRA